MGRVVCVQDKLDAKIGSAEKGEIWYGRFWQRDTKYLYNKPHTLNPLVKALVGGELLGR